MDLESLELHRLRADLITTYKVIFGLLDVSSNFFVVRDNSVTRGHPGEFALTVNDLYFYVISDYRINAIICNNKQYDDSDVKGADSDLSGALLYILLLQTINKKLYCVTAFQ